MNLGDPQLGNLDTSKPIVAMLFKTPPSDAPSGPPPFAVFIPAKAAAPYDQAFTRMNMVSAFADGVLIVAQNADALTKAQAQIGAFQKIVDAKITGDLRVFVSAGNLMESYGPVIQKGMDALTQQLSLLSATQAKAAGGQMDPQTLAKIGAAEMKIMAEMVNQFDSLQYEIGLKADVVSIDSLISAKKGSPLSELFSAPLPGTNKALLLLTKPGSLAGGGRINAAGYKSFTTKLITTVLKDPALADLNTKEMQDMVATITGAFAGDFAMSMDADPAGGFAMESVMTVTDDKKYLELLEQMSKLMGPESAIGKLYATMGMKMDFTMQKAVRQHAGIDVHRIKVSFDTSKMPPAQAAQMKAMTKDTELAIVKGLYLASYNPADLDKMIDKALATTALTPDVSLESITAFGAGKHMYLDADMVAFMQASLATMPGNPAAAMFSQIKSKAPTLMAGSFANGRALVQARISLAPFIEMSALARKAGGRAAPPPNNPNNGQGGGGEAEKPKDDKF
jgi:hypothetical protein